MKDINTVKDLKRMLRDPFALCFFYLDQSIHARAVDVYLGMLERMIQMENNPCFNFMYRGDPWKQRFLHPWIYSNRKLQFRNKDGHLTCIANRGSLVWLKHGKVMDVERAVLKQEIEDLWQRTKNLMARANVRRRPLPSNARIDRLKSQIEQAFSGVKPPSKIANDWAHALDELKPFLNKSWRSFERVPAKLIEENSCALYYLNSAAYRHFLPAYMTWCLDHRWPRSPSLEGTILTVLPMTKDKEVCPREPFELINRAQARAILEFLLTFKSLIKRTWKDDSARLKWSKRIEEGIAYWKSQARQLGED